MLRVFLISCILFPSTIAAQVWGCTDVVATNFNPLATVNDGSCLYAPSTIAPVSSYNISDTLSETSGLACLDGHLWTHNDNTDTRLYLIDTLGNSIGGALIPGVANTDWEDLAQDTDYFYIADVGNNSNGNRTNLHILRIGKDSLYSTHPEIDTIWFVYSDQTDFSPTGANNTDFDCEAVVAIGDSLVLFTKQWVTKQTSMYTLSKSPGTWIATRRAQWNVNGLITGATSFPDTSLVVLTGYSTSLQPFFVLLYDFPAGQCLGGNKRKININLPFHQTEGIATMNGRQYFVTNEYFSTGITTAQKLHRFDLSEYVSHFLGTAASMSALQERPVLLYPDPANDHLHIRVDATEFSWIIFDVRGNTMDTGTSCTPETQVSVQQLPSGWYDVRVMLNATSWDFPVIVAR